MNKLRSKQEITTGLLHYPTAKLNTYLADFGKKIYAISPDIFLASNYVTPPWLMNKPLQTLDFLLLEFVQNNHYVTVRVDMQEKTIYLMDSYYEVDFSNRIPVFFTFLKLL